MITLFQVYLYKIELFLVKLAPPQRCWKILKSQSLAAVREFARKWLRSILVREKQQESYVKA